MSVRRTRDWAALLGLGLGVALLAGCGSDKYQATTTLSGANEVPAVTTVATGTATARLENDVLTVEGSFSGLESDLAVVQGSSAHIHEAPVGASGPIIFNLTVTSTTQRSGTFVLTESLSDAQQTAFKDGRYYVNVHTANNLGGEIRGQLVPTKVD